jgi:uncharacterized phage protein (TIGR02220 family)
MWAYAAENQPDGDLSGYQAEELAMLLGYSGDATSMLQALKDCGFMDLDGMIHDWMEHNSYHKKFSVRAKKAAKARWAKSPPQTPPVPEVQGKRKGESGDKQCLDDATSIKPCTTETSARILLHLLNEKTGRHFRETDSSLTPIIARLKEPGVDLDGCKLMIDRQVKRWKGSTQEEYLRPETLFGKTKFESYYAAKDLPIQQYEPDQRNGHHKTNSLNPAADRRNAGTIGDTDYGAAGIRKLAKQEAARLATEQTADKPPSPPA